MKLLNRGSVDKAQAGAELSITHLLHCFAGFIILPFRTDSTAVPPHIPVKGKGQVKMCRRSRGIASGQSALRALDKGLVGGAHCRGLSKGWLGCATGRCSSLAVTFPGSSSAQAELGFLSWEWWGCLLKRQGGAGSSSTFSGFHR